jgi:RNA polymerase sigma-70 factor (ECF subfamily)
MDEADDITQDVCLALADKIQSFRGDSSFSTWLYRLVVNACKDHIKKQATRRQHAQGYMELEQQQRAGSADTNKMVAWLYREVGALDEPLKTTALLVLAEDLSHAEAGKVLGCAESTVSWRMHEIRKILKARKGA